MANPHPNPTDLKHKIQHKRILVVSVPSLVPSRDIGWKTVSEMTYECEVGHETSLSK